MYRTASYPKALSAEPAALSSRSFALGGALMLVSLSYLLLLAVPAVSKHFRGLSAGYAGGAGVESWLPIASVSGLALGGGAALLFVLMQIAREAAQRPYVALAPVLAAFAGCILIGLRAPLPMPGVASEHVAVFALAVSVVGGALVQEAGLAARLAGLAFTFLPSVSLLAVVWTVSGKSDPWLALWSLPATTRAYLTMLAVSSSAIAMLAVLGRRCVADAPVSRGDWSMAAQADALMEEARRYEQSYAADEAALARRGLPTWLIACLSAVAVVGGFFVLKQVLDARASRSPASLVSSAFRAPLQLDPVEVAVASQPTVTALVVPELAEPILAKPALAEPALDTHDAVAEVPAVAVESFRSRAEPQQLTESPTLHTSRRSSRRAHRNVEARPRAAEQAAVVPAREEKVEARPLASEQKAEKRGAAQSVRSVQVDKPVPAAPATLVAAPAPAAHSKAPEKSLAARLLAKPSDKTATEKLAPARGDESLDELMDNIVKSKRANKAGVGAGDDPIFGL